MRCPSALALLPLALFAMACGARVAGGRAGEPSSGGEGGSAGAGASGAGGSGGADGSAGFGGFTGAGGSGGAIIEAAALGLSIDVDPLCDGGWCPPRLTGTVWLAAASGATGEPVLRVAGYDGVREAPLDGSPVVLTYVTVAETTAEVGFREARVEAYLETLQIDLDLLPGGLLRVRAVTGEGATAYSYACGDVGYREEGRIGVRQVPFQGPVLQAVPRFGRDPGLPGDEVAVTSATSSFDVRSARVVAGTAVDASWRSLATVRRPSYAFDALAPLGLGASATLQIEGVDLAGQTFRSEVPIATLAAAPGERAGGFDDLSGYASQGVEIVERGSLPGTAARVAVSGWGRLAFELDVPVDATSLAVLASTVARGEGGEGTFLRVSVFSGAERDTQRIELAPALHAVEPKEIPLGYAEHAPATVVLASDVEELRHDLTRWAGRHVVIVLGLDGRYEESLGCPPPWTAVVLHRVDIEHGP